MKQELIRGRTDTNSEMIQDYLAEHHEIRSIFSIFANFSN